MRRLGGGGRAESCPISLGGERDLEKYHVFFSTRNTVKFRENWAKLTNNNNNKNSLN